MAITLDTHSVDRAGFVANGYSADWSGCEELVAAVTGQSIYVEKVYISSGAAITLTLGIGETGGAVTNELIGPVYMAANSNTFFEFTRPIKLTAATALVADGSGAGAATIVVQGYIK